jgi:hypothetical protein
MYIFEGRHQSVPPAVRGRTKNSFALRNFKVLSDRVKK